MEHNDEDYNDENEPDTNNIADLFASLGYKKEYTGKLCFWILNIAMVACSMLVFYKASQKRD